MADNTPYVDEWLAGDEEVDMLAASVGHHHATGHPGGGGGADYDCDECPFTIRDGWVVAGGMIRTAAQKDHSVK